MMTRGQRATVLGGWMWCGLVAIAAGSGMLRNGAGANSMGVAGADVAAPGDVLGAMVSNPAGLAMWDGGVRLTLSGVAGLADAEFNSANNRGVGLEETFGAAPELGISVPLGYGGAVVGFSVVPEAGRIGDWNYFDEPGGLDGVTSFGMQNQEAVFKAVRLGLGVGIPVGERLLVGGSFGAVWNEIRINAPFIFQSEPTLAGFKTLLDLQTEGWGWNGDLGAIAQVSDSVRAGVRWRSTTGLISSGRAVGDASAQLRSLGGGFATVEPGFKYDAEVDTALPQVVSGGISWEVSDRLTLLAQVDWIGWSDAFDTLDIELSNGTNDAINGVVGGSDTVDRVPLEWDDVFVYRFGARYQVNDSVEARLGYAYGRSPIPGHLVTPLNAVVTEHTLSGGLGFRRGKWSVDAAVQWDLPVTTRVGRSGIRSGEYSNSSVGLETFWFGLGVTREF